MGQLKRWMEQQDAQRWSFTDRHVCRSCVDDNALATVIDDAAIPEEACDFCGRTPAASLDVLLEVFVDGLQSEYGDADDEGVYYDGAEGGYQWHTWHTWDLVMYEVSDVLIGDGLAEAVCGAMDDRTWVERNFIEPRRDEALLYSWHEFCQAIQHETRYVFFLRRDRTDPEPGYVPTGQILGELGELIANEGLVTEMPAGQRFWRARTRSERNVEWGAGDLGTVPPDNAKYANRMSPAGIPLFYGSADPDTALREVAVRAPDDHEWASIAAFDTSQSCYVVDFTRLPTPPSMFDPDNRHRRRPMIFLHKFVEDLKKPARPTWEQLDYVPTQVVTEYLLRIFNPGVPIVGLLYPSAQTGEPSVVLNVPNDRCVEQVDGWREHEHLQLGMIHGITQARQCAQQE